MGAGDLPNTMNDDTKKKILAQAQKGGLVVLGLALKALTRILFGKGAWTNSSSSFVTNWRYHRSIPHDNIPAVDRALRENLSASNAVDKLARQAGISRDCIFDSNQKPTE